MHFRPAREQSTAALYTHIIEQEVMLLGTEGVCGV